jgi:hypothetical protein
MSNSNGNPDQPQRDMRQRAQANVGRLRRELKPPELIKRGPAEEIELIPIEETEPEPPEDIAVHFPLRAGAPRFGFEGDPKLARIDDRERQ